MRFILILLFVLLLSFPTLNLQAEENDLMLEARITQPDESRGGELDFTVSIEETLRDGDLEKAYRPDDDSYTQRVQEDHEVTCDQRQRG